MTQTNQNWKVPQNGMTTTWITQFVILTSIPEILCTDSQWGLFRQRAHPHQQTLPPRRFPTPLQPTNPMNKVRSPHAFPPPQHTFSPPLHPSRTILPNAYREAAVISSQALRPNLPIGDCLQSLLDIQSESKNYTLIENGQPFHSNQLWRSQTLRFYFQNVNGLRTADNGSDILDAFFSSGNYQSQYFRLCRD